MKHTAGSINFDIYFVPCKYDFDFNPAWHSAVEV